jgi:hypothetical protein
MMPHKRRRATQAEMAAREAETFAIVHEIRPCGVRQTYYQTVVRRLMDKTENDYAKVQRAIVKMRRDGRMPYGWIVDGTRWMHKPTTFSSLEHAVRRTVETYRRAVWDDQPVRVEFWLEKEALAGVIYDVTSEFDVPLYVARGFSSLTYLAEAAQDIEDCGRPVYIYHLGDHDPSGRAAGAHIERTLRELAPNAEIHFERLAVTVRADHSDGPADPADQGQRLTRRKVRSPVWSRLGRTVPPLDSGLRRTRRAETRAAAGTGQPKYSAQRSARS